ncbi:MAG: hypothetical protein CMN76_18255 [Spirochaetaceae bacterium]|nr:hypothetical protein [Spirochaetaceae bacterium]|tara:strand:+ start:228080 stop:229198 length:1119 start_codon:yes stop_codon:yes gene_type:complete
MLWEILWRKKITFSLGFCVLFSITCILWQRNPFAAGAALFGKLADEIGGAINSGLSLPGELWVRVDQYQDLQEKYDQAQKRLEEYRLEKDKFDALRRDNEKLREALDFPPLDGVDEITAEVIGTRLNSISPRILIRAGRKDGVRPFMPVICKAHDENKNLIRAVVGIVAIAGDSSSVVQPLIHPGFNMGVRMPHTGQWAIFSGNSGSVTRGLLTYLSSDSFEHRTVFKDPSVEILKTPVYTSGQGGIFPPDIPVGIITGEGNPDGEFRTAMVKPYAPIDRLDTVVVLLKSPSPWAEQFEREKIEDNLVTEFGPPVFPDLPEVEKRLKEQEEARKRAAQNQDQQEETQEEETPEPQGPGPRRRLENLNIPGAQ